MSRNEQDAVIWDMDGVLVDTYEFHFQAWSEIYQRFSGNQKPLSRTQFESVFGMLNDETVIRLFGKEQATPDFIEMVAADWTIDSFSDLPPQTLMEMWERQSEID